jgi:hypothetical protein
MNKMFDNNDSSYIKMTSKEVLDRCNLIISQINKKREQEDRQYIAKEIKKRRRWIKRFSFLKRFLPSDRTARQESEDDHGWDKYGIFPSIYGWGDLRTAKQCRGLAKRSQDKSVFLSREDFSDIFRDEVDE